MTGLAEVRVLDWWDLFTFENGPTGIMCPDCEQVSPDLDNIFRAAQWVEKHLGECPA